MRKSSLVKAMACFMAATMAITCVPSANVVNGVSIVAQAAEMKSQSFVGNEAYSGEQGEVIAAYKNFARGISAEGDFSVEATFSGKTNFPRWCMPGVSIQGASGNIYVRQDSWIDDLDETASVRVPLLDGVAVEQSEWESIVNYFGSDGSDIKISVSRAGKAVSIVYEATSTAASGPAAGKTYKGTYEFEYEGALDLCFGANYDSAAGTLTADEFYHMTSFTNKADYVVSPLPSGVKYDDTTDSYMIPVSATDIVTATEDGGYIVDETKIFVGGNNNTEVAGIGELQTVTASIGADFRTYDFKYQLFENKCDKISIIDDVANRKIGFGDSYDVTVKVTGEDATGIVSDVLTPTVVSGQAGVTLKSSDVANNEYVYTITPTKSGTGEVKFVCGDQEATSSYNAVDNVCISLASEQGETITTRPNQRTTITMVALATDSSLKLSNEIEVVSSSGIIEVTGEPTTSAIKLDGVSRRNFYVVASTGEGLIRFRCGDITRDIKIVGRNASTDTTTPTTPTEPTTPEEPTTPAEPTTPGGVDTTPEEPTTPTEPTTPEEPTTPTEPTTPEEPSTTTTKKKVAKLSSVKATKGKKAVSGKVTIKATGKNVKKATIKVYVNGKKNVTTTTKATGKFSVKVSKKLKKGDKVKVVATKTTIKKVTKTVTVK